MDIFKRIGIFVLMLAVLFVSCTTNADDVLADNSNTVSSNGNDTVSEGNDNTVPVSDVILTFNVNGGAWSDGTNTKTISGKLNAAFTAPDTPVKTGYKFTGWNPVLPEKIPQANATYTATWTLAGNFIIIYELNGGTNSAENPTGYNIETETFELKPATKIGYTFCGWYKDANFTTGVTQIEKGSTENVTLYAKWTANAYTVIFHANNGTNKTKSQNFIYDVEQALTENAFSKTGYVFAGWATAENGNAAYADNAAVSNLATENTVDLYAVWVKGTNTKYKVEHYQQNTEGEGYTLCSTDNLTGITDSATLAVAKNYTGFDVQNFDQSTIAADGSTVVKIYYNRKTVTFTFKDGDTVLQTIQGRYGTTVSETPTDPTKAGFIFKQWSAATPTIFESDRTILAEWTEITITLSKTNLVLVWGGTAQLTAKVMPETLADKTVTWSSSYPIDIDLNGNVTASGYDGSYDETAMPKIIITAECNGAKATCNLAIFPKVLTQTNFRKLFPNYATITECEIPEGVIKLKKIDQNVRAGVFYGCSELTKITLPQSLKIIEESTFSECAKLKDIEIPSNVTSIGKVAFSGCSSLEEITIPDGVSEILISTFSGCSKLAKINLSKNLTLIDEWAFKNCSKLSEITLPENLKKIGEGAFENCSSLSNITIPETVTSIGGGAFSACGLKKINIPSEITSLEAYSAHTATIAGMFYNCKKLEEVEFTPNSKLESIPAYTFSGCSSLSKFKIPKGVTVIEDGVFNGCGLTEIEIPDSVTSIGKSAFVGCANLVEVKTPLMPAPFGDYFSTTVKKLTVTKKIPDAPYNTDYNYSFETVIIGDDVTSIGQYAFYNCGNLKDVTIGNGVTSIGERAFFKTGLISVVIPSSVKWIDPNAFYQDQENLKLDSVTFEETSGWKCNYQIYSSTTGWSSVHKASIDVTTPYINAKKFRGDGVAGDSVDWAYFGIYRE